MLRQKKGKAEISPGEPQFPVRYVGSTQVFVASGVGCTQRPVQTIWDSAPAERHLSRALLHVSAGGLTLTGAAGGSETKYDIKHISYCCAASSPHERVFAWICKNAAARRLECHAVLAASREKAQAMAIILNRSFHVAYRDWKQEQGRQSRQDARVSSERKTLDETSRSDHEHGGGQNGANQDNGLDASEQAALNAALEQMNIVEEGELDYHVIHEQAKT